MQLACVVLSGASVVTLFRVGTGLRHRDAATQTILGDGILASYMVGHINFSVGLTHLFNCANIRDFLATCMYPIPSVTKPQAFKICKDLTDGLVKMPVQFREYNDNWGVTVDKSKWCASVSAAFPVTDIILSGVPHGGNCRRYHVAHCNVICFTAITILWFVSYIS